MNATLQADDYRGLPFWSWNGKLCETELRRQIRIFREMGYAGFFMHSRSGLNTEYLGREWFDSVRACIDEARIQGLEAWLYDEDRYASGSGGGEIGRNRRFRRRTLEVAVLEKPIYRQNDLAWFAGELRGTALFRCRRLEKGDCLQSGESFLRFHVRFDRPNSWNNGGCFSDMMNADGMSEFIRMTHERYAEECGTGFGGPVPGIFSDEPNYSNWTEDMEKKFAQRYGENLLDRLPELFFEIDGRSCSKLRWQMAELRTELLVSAFAVQAAEWCREHHLLYTGHVFGEEDVVAQTTHCGSAMRFVWHMDIPGVDVLSDHNLVYDAMLQTASAAHQNGSRQILSESFAGTGWDFPLYAQKAAMDWQLALGITRFCSHLAFYTLQGEAKRDYPPSIHYQSPWYRLEKMLQDYASTVGFMLGSGEPVCPILVVHPLESTWFWKPLAAYNRGDREREARRLPRLRNVLLRAKLAFDYGDEAIIAEFGSCRDGMLRVRHAAYAAVVLPELRTIRATTLRLLEQFADLGGKVFHLGRIPEFADGESSSEPRRVYRKFIPATPENLPAALAAVQTVSVTDEDGRAVEPVLCREVQCGSERRLFLCNTGCTLPLSSGMMAKGADERTLTVPLAEIRWKGEPGHPPCELDPMTGQRMPVNAVYRKGRWEFRTSFSRLESRLFLAGGEYGIPQRKPAAVSARNVRRFSVSDGPWPVQPDEPNVLPLDFAEYSIDAGCVQYGHVREADAAARQLLGLPKRCHEMIQPWKQKKLQDNSRSVGVVLRFRFECRDVPEELSLALEEADRYDILLNGRAVECRQTGWWCDSSLGVVPLAAEALRNGENVLELRCNFCGAMSGFEAVYLLGDFGVSENELTAPVRSLRPGDWGLQGYPYYSGNMTFRLDFEWHEPAGTPVFPSIAQWSGSAIGFTVNDGEPQIAFLQPERLNLGKYLKPGRNTMKITVYGSRRNSFGPFGAEPVSMVGPSEFSYSSPSERRLKPYGLLSGIQFIFSDEDSSEKEVERKHSEKKPASSTSNLE